jgi:hypothetical protein
MATFWRHSIMMVKSDQPGEVGDCPTPFTLSTITSKVVVYATLQTERADHRVHTEWQWPLSGAHSIMMVKSAQPGKVVRGDAHPPPFAQSTITSKVVVYAPAERADHRVHTEWQWQTFGVHSIMMVKSGLCQFLCFS